MTCLRVHHLSKFQLSNPNISRAIGKKVYESSFQDRFLSRPLYFNINLKNHTVKFWAFWSIRVLSRPFIPFLAFFTFPFKTIVLSTPLLLVYLQHNGYRTAHIPTTPVWLAIWRPTWGLQAVERPNSIGPGGIQHQQGKMVCHNHWFSRHRRLQTVDEPPNLHQWDREEETQGSLCSHRKHPRLLHIILELHQWDVQMTPFKTIMWNYRMYRTQGHQDGSFIRQGEHETTDQLDQCIKQLVEKCQYQNQDVKKVWQTELLFHVTKHFEVKKWVRSQDKQENFTYEKLLEHAKQHERMVKDFNWHKTNGGVAKQPLLTRSRPSNPGTRVTATKAKVAPARHVAGVTSLTHKVNAQPRVRSVTGVGNQTISVCVVGLGTAMKPKTETTMDQAIRPAETPNERRETEAGSGNVTGLRNQRTGQHPGWGVPTALNLSPFKTMMKISMGDNLKKNSLVNYLQTWISMRDYPRIPFKTIAFVLILLKRHLIPFLGPSQWVASAMR